MIIPQQYQHQRQQRQQAPPTSQEATHASLLTPLTSIKMVPAGALGRAFNPDTVPGTRVASQGVRVSRVLMGPFCCVLSAYGTMFTR